MKVGRPYIFRMAIRLERSELTQEELSYYNWFH